MYLLINQRLQHHIVTLLLHKFHFELAIHLSEFSELPLSPRRYVDVVGINLKAIVAPEQIEIFHWNFGNIFFDSFTNNLWHRQKFDFLSNLNLFPPLKVWIFIFLLHFNFSGSWEFWKKPTVPSPRLDFPQKSFFLMFGEITCSLMNIILIHSYILPTFHNLCIRIK